ncbi:MAG: PAS domain S-box protein, partial [Dongiaceae bacterium]
MPTPMVMIVEDERIVAQHLCLSLTELGYNAGLVATDGATALRHIAQRRPDVVLMDIQIDGDIDGIETAARIPPELMVPVIYLTAHSDDATLERARATKPYGYLIKPFSERELHATIKIALDRRMSDVALRESEDRLRLALTAAELGSWEVDPETGRFFWRDHADWLADATPKAVTESVRDFLLTVYEADRDNVHATFDRSSADGGLCEIDFRRSNEAGQLRWIRVVGKTFYNENDRRRRLVGVARDITDVKLAEQERNASERSYRELISTIDGIIWEEDCRSNAITYISDSVARVLGYTAAQWMADPLFWEKHLHPEDAAQAMAKHRSCSEAGKSYQSSYRMIANGGEVVWIHEVVSTIAQDGDIVFLRGVMVDITMLKKAEQEIAATGSRQAESEERLAAILDTAAMGIITVDEDFRIISFNREAERVFGYSAEEMIGGTPDRLIPTQFLEDYRLKITNFLKGNAPSWNTGDWRSVAGLAADGTVVPLSTIISKVTIAGKSIMTAIMRDMTQVQKTEEELRQLLKDRELAVARAEAANLAKSSFLAVMSHELRTPLNAIIGFSELMSREIMGPIGNDAYRQYITDIHDSGALLLNIVNSILDLSRIESGKHDLSIVGVGLKDVWTPIAGTLAANAATKGVELLGPRQIPDCKFAADPHAVSQILLNLVSNAIKFTTVGGTVEVGLEDDRDRREVAIFVRDNGRGIPADKLTDVLKPFVQVSNSYA